MGKKLAAVDAQVMNALYGAELAKVGMKVAADALTDEKGAPHGDQAFADHAEYLDNIKSALKSDKNVEGNDPNSVLVD
jgi:hypothetical protein